MGGLGLDFAKRQESTLKTHFRKGDTLKPTMAQVVSTDPSVSARITGHESSTSASASGSGEASSSSGPFPMILDGSPHAAYSAAPDLPEGVTDTPSVNPFGQPERPRLSRGEVDAASHITRVAPVVHLSRDSSTGEVYQELISPGGGCTAC